MKKIILLLLIAVSTLAWAKPVTLHSGQTACVVDTMGARVLSYSVNGDEVIWCPPKLELDHAPWVHGGIPICWPWFGGNADHQIHGFSWRREFEIVERSENRLALRLIHDYAELKCVFTVTEKLSVEAETRNFGNAAFSFSFGFHPYFLVGSSASTIVDGVAGLPFADDASVPNGTNGVCTGSVRILGHLDRIFQAKSMSSIYRIHDADNKRRIVVSSEGSNFVNIWNPGSSATTPGKLDSDQISRFVAVEPIYCRDLDVGLMVLKPGERHVVRLSVALEK